MKNLPKVLVFVSTYNGEQYLKVQLDSIIAQKDVDVSILVSDDLSKDNTVKILEEYAKEGKIKYRVNKTNKNFTYNFLDMIYENVDSDFDYFALADQDDFWLEDKLISGIQKLQAENKHFYCSNLSVVDGNLSGAHPMNKFKIKNQRHTPNILENICTGCTAIFDREFMKALSKHYPNNIYLHDYWLMLVAVFVSNFVYDETPHILYRQHGNNMIGSEKEGLSEYYKKFSSSKSHRHQLVEELITGFKDDISERDLKDLNAFLKYKKNFFTKFGIFFSPRWRCKNHPFLKKIKILFNKY